MVQKKIKVVTHGGGFHADDVFAMATLFLVLGKENVSITRTYDFAIAHNGDYVFDVGGEYDPERNRFDHHQIGGAGKRSNGVEYASFGLVWKKFGPQLCGSQEAADDIDYRLVQTIDGHDNGMEMYSAVYPDTSIYDLSLSVFAFERAWREEERDIFDAFLEMVDWAMVLLRREIRYTQGRISAFKEIEKIYSSFSGDRHILVFQEGTEWARMLVCAVMQKHQEVIYFVRQHLDGSWQAIGAVDKITSPKVRKDFPQSWWGKRDQELVDVTGVSDAVFCHRTGFMCVAKSKEGAIKLAELALAS